MNRTASAVCRATVPLERLAKTAEGLRDLFFGEPWKLSVALRVECKHVSTSAIASDDGSREVNQAMGRITVEEIKARRAYERKTRQFTLRPRHLASLVHDARLQVVLAFSRD
jgi:hypothetical protein